MNVTVGEIIHVGVRPEHDLEMDDSNSNKKRNIIYYEIFPDGGHRIWNKKLLNSGCGNIIKDVRVDENTGLIYCSYCREWCNSNQFTLES